jgi:hypothetical protein
MNPLFKNLTIKQKQQVMRFIEEHKLDFPHKSIHLFSMAQFVRRRLLAPIGQTITNNQYRIKNSYEEFLKRCSRKFGIFVWPQVIDNGRSQLNRIQDIFQFQLSVLLQNPILSISHYGTAVFLGNTSAIAEMYYFLSKSKNVENRLKRQFIQLIEYGISHKCQDCLGMMSHILDVGLYGIGTLEKPDPFKLAGQSAEAGSVYGWFFLANFLKKNSDHASYHKHVDDELYISEDDLGVRQFVRPSLSLDEQIRRALEENGCESCIDQFYYGKERCSNCDFEFDVFNNYPDDDMFVSKMDQMRIAVDIYYKILNENLQSHPIWADSRRNLIQIYKENEMSFGGSRQATDKEILRLEAI